MINYPDNSNPNSCGIAMSSDLDEKTILDYIAVTRTVGMMSQSMEQLSVKLAECCQILNAERQQHDQTRFRLHYAEDQEEICGQIAKGEFTKIEMPEKFYHLPDMGQYHNYTDSQNAVKLLLEAKTAAFKKCEQIEAASKLHIADLITQNDSMLQQRDIANTEANSALQQVQFLVGKREENHKQIRDQAAEIKLLRAKIRSLTRKRK